jgi:hypothetical protein
MRTNSPSNSLRNPFGKAGSGAVDLRYALALVASVLVLGNSMIR